MTYVLVGLENGKNMAEKKKKPIGKIVLIVVVVLVALGAFGSLSGGDKGSDSSCLLYTSFVRSIASFCPGLPTIGCLPIVLLLTPGRASTFATFCAWSVASP